MSMTLEMIWPCSPPRAATRVRQTEILCGGRADQRGIVPGQLGDRLGQFLQPAIVGKAAVVNAWDRAGK